MPTQKHFQFAIRAVASATLVLCASFSAHAVDSFNPVTNLLAIDQIAVQGLGNYKAVSVTVNSYALLGVDNGTPLGDAFDPATNLLNLGAVLFQGVTYNNVRVRLNSYTLISATPDSAASNVANPVLFVTQVPVSGFTSRGSTFGNHLASVQSAPRGGDLMIRYPDGSVRNLTQEAGYGNAGFQGANSIAVREPAVHWSGTKAVFSMVVGSPANRYEVKDFVWQMYEISGLEKGGHAVITKVAGQPSAYNNVSPIYGTDERILFTSDRPRGGETHLYPQLDEYESAATVTGIWSMQPGSGDLRLLNHTVSGAFSPSIDSFGRVIFTRWDHLQQDQQADADRADPANKPYGSFLYSDESAGAGRLGLIDEVFPEPRLDANPVNIVNQTNGHTFNNFMPWQVNEDGTAEETLNHVGRHEIAGTYIPPNFKNDPSLSYYSNESLFANRTYLRGDGGVFHLREDPTHAGVFYGTHAREFGTDAANQIVRMTGSPNLNAEQMVITPVTDPATAGFTADGATPVAGHTGMYRNPLPMSDGSLLAVHTSETRLDQNDGTTAMPQYRYKFRIKTMVPSGATFAASQPITTGTQKAVWYWDPDTRVDFNDVLWELDPVEVRARAKPSHPASPLETPEASILQEEGVNEAQLRSWLTTNNLALIVTRNNTSRDQGERQQPFNLQVPGGVKKVGDGGKVYNIAHLQLFQADQIRGYGGTASPRAGRRVLAQVLHDPKATNPANPGAPAGSVKLAADGSSAAFVPARRAMTWQLTDAGGAAVVRERNWITFQPGEIRTCASCHGLNSKDQAGGTTPTNKPEALRTLLQYWKTLPH